VNFLQESKTAASVIGRQDASNIPFVDCASTAAYLEVIHTHEMGCGCNHIINRAPLLEWVVIVRMITYKRSTLDEQ
jgi:hypothetical protein